jgi:hypothetical protein
MSTFSDEALSLFEFAPEPYDSLPQPAQCFTPATASADDWRITMGIGCPSCGNAPDIRCPKRCALHGETGTAVVDYEARTEKRRAGEPIGSISAARLSKSRYRAWAWRDIPDGTPSGGPLGTIDGDSLGEVTHEMLRAIRGERGFDP